LILWILFRLNNASVEYFRDPPSSLAYHSPFPGKQSPCGDSPNSYGDTLGQIDEELFLIMVSRL
jgi:hypothetical protein